MKLRTIVLSLSVLFSACAKTSGPAVEVSQAWSPLAPPGATVIAVYADIAAHRSDTLLSVSTPLAGSAQLHSSVEEAGMMKMRPVTRLEVRQGETVHLAPGGMHLMLMDIRQPLAAGAQLPLTFHFENAGDVPVTAQVRAQ